MTKLLISDNSSINIHINSSVNVNNNTLKMVNSQLLDEIIDCASLINNSVKIDLVDSACVNPLTRTDLTNSVLMATAIDAEYTLEPIL